MNISPTDLIRFVVEIKIFEHESLNKEQYLTEIPFNYHFLELIKINVKEYYRPTVKALNEMELSLQAGQQKAEVQCGVVKLQIKL